MGRSGNRESCPSVRGLRTRQGGDRCGKGLTHDTLVQAFRTAVQRLKDDDLDVDLARDCAGKAWHLCDHVFKALGSNSEFAKLTQFQEHIKAACPELAYLQDICIESKHAQITMYKPRIDDARVHIGDFSREDFCSEARAISAAPVRRLSPIPSSAAIRSPVTA